MVTDNRRPRETWVFYVGDEDEWHYLETIDNPRSKKQAAETYSECHHAHTADLASVEDLIELYRSVHKVTGRTPLNALGAEQIAIMREVRREMRRR